MRRTSMDEQPSGDDVPYGQPPRQMLPTWRAAVDVLDANWDGGHTVPSRTLYPHQWSWDSAFIAVGLARVAPSRAAAELESLLAAQWTDGRVPHIVFNPRVPAAAYFPGPRFWRSGAASGRRDVVTSGIVQPPVHAIAALRVCRQGGGDTGTSFLRRLYPRLVAQHRYLAGYRDLGRDGLAAIVHPWESGLDNSPAWDRPLDAVTATDAAQAAVDRRDLRHAAAADRPTDDDYARYVALASTYRDVGYADRRLPDAYPFRVEDPLFNAVWAASEEALAEIAAQIGADPGPHRDHAAAITDAMVTRLLDRGSGMFYARDLATGELLRVPTVGGLSALLLPDLPAPVAAGLAQLAANRFGLDGQAGYPLPSYPSDGPAFERRRYWRGPTWLNTNWLVREGLRRYGRDDLADGLAGASLALVERSGFREYFDPFDGSGYGSPDFSWSAALALDILATSPNARPDSD